MFHVEALGAGNLSLPKSPIKTDAFKTWKMVFCAAAKSTRQMDTFRSHNQDNISSSTFMNTRQPGALKQRDVGHATTVLPDGLFSNQKSQFG
jgi:hypothetical protein